MAEFKDVNEAKKFIAHTEKSDNIYKDDSGFTHNKSETFHHLDVANDFVKLISTAPISPKCKNVMITKILNPGISITRVAILNAISEDDVKKYEEEGIYICKKLLEAAEDAIIRAKEKFNADEVIQREVKKLQGGNPTL